MALSNGIQVHGCGERGDSLDAVGLAGGGRIAPVASICPDADEFGLRILQQALGPGILHPPLVLCGLKSLGSPRAGRQLPSRAFVDLALLAVALSQGVQGTCDATVPGEAVEGAHARGTKDALEMTCLVLLEVLHALLTVPTELVAGPGVVAAGAHFIGSTAGWDLCPQGGGPQGQRSQAELHWETRRLHVSWTPKQTCG